MLSAFAASFALGASVLTSPATGAQCSVDQPVDDVPQAFVTCTGVHVGMRVVVRTKRGWNTCVAGFAFADQYGRRYLTIPGSCVLTGECRWPALLDPVPEIVKEIAHGLVCEHVPENEEKKYAKPAEVTDEHLRRIGAVVYAVNVFGESRSYDDMVEIALVRLDKGVRLDPAMPFYGGPTRLGDFANAPDEAYAFSPPDGDTRLPNARAGLLMPRGFGPQPTVARYHYAGLWPFSGETHGTPVMRTDGTALGFHHNIVTPGWGFPTLGLPKLVKRAERFTGLRLRLLTAPLAR
jgi:hypothetical protein